MPSVAGAAADLDCSRSADIKVFKSNRYLTIILIEHVEWGQVLDFDFRTTALVMCVQSVDGTAL